MTRYECDKCEKSFESEDAREQHEQDYDHSKLQECPDCDETFSSEGEYQDHRKTHRNAAQEVMVSLSWKHLLGVGVVVLLVAGVFVGLSGSSGQDSSVATDAGETGTRPGMTAADATFTTADGETKQLSDYRGQKVMFWVFATWCPSCKQGARALQANNDELQDVKIIALKTAGNAGYSGPSISGFAQQYAPRMVNADNWVWGDLSTASTSKWNPQNRPDIYWLIAEDGTIQAKTGAPAATIDRITQFAETQEASSSGDRPGTSYETQGRQHVPQGQSHPDYNSNPPTSGWHYPKSADWGFYTKELPDERVVHNLEHGGIWISYTSNVSQTTADKLRSVAQENPKSVIVTKRNANDAPIAVASWGQLMELQQFDKQRIETFIEENMNNSPEPFAG